MSSIYMRTLQYKVLHRAYTTRSKLYLYKILESPTCPFCEEDDDNFEHALYKCALSRHTWSNFQVWLDKYRIPVQLSISNIILGINGKITFGHLLNTLLIRIKQILLSPKESRRALSLEEIEKIVVDQLRVERIRIGKSPHKYKGSDRLIFIKRWGHLPYMIDP